MADLDGFGQSGSFEQALRRLGWLNTHARQVLICRYMLRQISTFDLEELWVLKGNESALLRSLRLAMTVLSGSNSKNRSFSAPYEPIDRPETHYLKYFRSFPVFSLSCASGRPEYTFFDGPDNSAGFEHSGGEVLEDLLFVHEVHEVGKAVSLNNKSLADDRANQLLNKPLWRGFTDTDEAACISTLQTFEQENPGVWKFWLKWFFSVVNGTPMPLKLQRQIASIDDAIWQAGPSAVAQEIERIELSYKTLIAPGLQRNSSDTTFVIQSEDALPADILEYARTRIASALENALDSAGQNGLSEQSYETITIRRALMENPSSASLLATGFYDACLSFESTIGERYPDDTSLTNLKNALWGVVEEINEVHPDARKRCARLAKLHQPPPTSQADQDMAAQVPDLIRGELSPEAQAVIESDVERILTEPKPPIGVKARFTNWVTTISMWMDKAKKGDQRAQWLAGVVERLLHWWDNDAG